MKKVLTMKGAVAMLFDTAHRAPDLYKAAYILSPTCVVTLTRKRYAGALRTRAKRADFVLTVGVPNYRIRKMQARGIKRKDPLVPGSAVLTLLTKKRKK